MIRNLFPLPCFFCFLVIAIYGSTASADIVVANLDYNVGFGGPTQSGAVAIGNAGDVWNSSASFFNFVGTESPSGNTGGTAPFGAVELNDTAGVGSGVSYQMTFVNDGDFGFNGVFQNLGNVAATDAANLLGDYLFVGSADGGESLNFELTGLDTNTTYNLYLYGNGDATGQGATWNLNGDSKTSAFDGTATIDEGGEFASFTFDTGLNTTQTFSATELGGSIAVNGFQLSVAAVPEPSSLITFMAFGLVGFTRRRRA